MASNNSVNGWKQTIGAGAPTTVAGNVGDQYFDNVGFQLYTCSVAGNPATFVPVSGGGASSIPLVYVKAIAAAAITGVYNNGTAGVGATITYTATGVQPIDGYTPVLNDLIVVPNQSSNFQNGVYTLTTVGATGVQQVLTRATAYNTPAGMNAPAIFKPLNGTKNVITTAFQLTNPIVTIGTTAARYGANVLLNNADTSVGTAPLTIGLNPGEIVNSASYSSLTLVNNTLQNSQTELGWSTQTPTSGFAITLSGTQHYTPLTPAGTLASGSITMPSGVNGLRCLVSTTQTITALSVLPDAGHTILGAPTTLLAGTSFEMIYNSANSNWIPYQGSSAIAPTPTTTLTPVTVTTSTQAMSPQTNYYVNGAAITTLLTLPTTAVVGSTMGVRLIGTATGFSIAQNAGQQIIFGAAKTSVGTGGTLTTTGAGQNVTLECVVANTTFMVVASQGNLTAV